MKNFILILLCLGGIISIAAIEYSNNSPGNKTGSPKDNANCTQCHNSTAIEANWITTNIPSEGYTPGQTYTITLNASSSTNNKFGFECTAENAGGAVGTYTITNSTDTKYLNTANSVTHTNTGTLGSNNEKTWSFDWTAPSNDEGIITLYAAFVSSNNSGNTQGDQIYVSNISYNCATTEITKTEESKVKISFEENNVLLISNIYEPTYIVITTINGKELYKKLCKEDEKILLDFIPRGNYIITAAQRKNTFSKQIIKK